MTPIERQSKALQLFDTLVELAPAEREAQLLTLAQSDPELAQEVQRLLAADAADSGMLDHGVHAVAKTVLDALNVEKSLAAGVQGGTLIGGFTLLRPLGQGGMGEVWLAERRQTQAQGDFVQQVALKLLKRGMDSEALVRRFVQERRILAELNHPHIARFIDGGISADGRLYYAMEFVEGVSMLQYARQNNLGVRECVQLMAEVCDAVAHAQAHLVVHRDLKPSNILVDKNAQPRVLDFGIAKLLDSSDPHHQTASELRAMTPIYAAPEQILGEPISTATDVYALGVILYQLLTGALPHQRSGALIGLADTVRLENIERPSAVLRRAGPTHRGQTTQADQTRAAREIAGDLDTVLLMALRQDPARRYANAAAFGSDLRAWLVGMPVAAQLDTRGYRIRNFVRRNRGVVGGASAVFLALLIGLSAAIWQAGVAREQAKRAEREAASSGRITYFALSLVNDLNPHGRANTEAKTPQQLLSASLGRARLELSNDPEARAIMLDKLGMLISATGDLALAENALQEAIEIATPRKAKELPTMQFNLAAIRMQQSRNAEAEPLLTLSIAGFDDTPEMRKYKAMAVSHLARIARSNGQLELALDRLVKAKLLFTQAWGADHANTIELDGNRATLLFDLGRYGESERAYRDTIANFERSQGPDFPRLMSPIAGLARIQALRGEPDSALGNFERALDIGHRKIGVADPYVVSAEIELVALLCAQGHIAQAHDRLNGINVANLAQRQTSQTALLRVRSCIARGEGKPVEAFAFLEQALVHANNANPKPNVLLAIVLSEMGLNAAERGEVCASQHLLSDARTMLDSLPQVLPIERLFLIEGEAMLLARNDLRVEATQLLQQALSDMQESVGTRSPELERVRRRMAIVATLQPAKFNCKTAVPS